MASSNDESTAATSDTVRIEGTDTIRAAVAELIAMARREALILSTDLQASLYDQQNFLDGIRQLAISGRQAKIRILVGDVDQAVKHGHRLVELARQLSSFIEIRRLDSDDVGLAETFLLVDRTGLLRQPVPAGHLALLSRRAPFDGRQRARRFEELWERATLDPNLRQLWL